MTTDNAPSPSGTPEAEQIDLRDTIDLREPQVITQRRTASPLRETESHPDSQRPSSQPDLAPFQTGRLLTSADQILAARRLHASVYLAKRFIQQSDLAPDGTISATIDPWHARSTHFGVLRRGEMVATARHIAVSSPYGLPALHLQDLHGAALEAIGSLPHSSVVEISALARSPRATSDDVMALYVSMWQRSMTLHHQVWVLAVDRPVFHYLRRYFCGHAVRAIGPEQYYLGSIVVPAVIWTHDVAAEHRRLAETVHDGWPMRPLLPTLFDRPSFPPLVDRAER